MGHGVQSWGGGYKIPGPHTWPPFVGLGRELGTTPGQGVLPSDDTLPKVWVSAGRRVG